MRADVVIDCSVFLLHTVLIVPVSAAVCGTVDPGLTRLSLHSSAPH